MLKTRWQPKFTGRHYYVRCKAWLYLYRMQLSGDYRMITARKLAENTGLNINSLRVMLYRWHKWGKIRCDSSSPVRRYALGEKGKRWLVKYQDDIREAWPELFYRSL